MYLECRPVFLLYLTNLFPSLYFVNQFVLHKKFIIGNEVCTDPHRPLKLGEIIAIPDSFYWRCVNNIVYRIMKWRAILNVPNYLEMNYVILALAVVSIPMKHQLTQPFSPAHQHFDINSLLRD